MNQTANYNDLISYNFMKIKKILDKLDQMYMVLLLHDLLKDVDSIWDQYKSANIPAVDEFIDHNFPIASKGDTLKMLFSACFSIIMCNCPDHRC